MPFNMNLTRRTAFLQSVLLDQFDRTIKRNLKNREEAECSRRSRKQLEQSEMSSEISTVDVTTCRMTLRLLTVTVVVAVHCCPRRTADQNQSMPLSVSDHMQCLQCACCSVQSPRVLRHMNCTHTCTHTPTRMFHVKSTFGCSGSLRCTPDENTHRLEGLFCCRS